ncbi:DUF1206 domain-containing protein [Scopulibacillus cellulosilyticus]|uniref:DUF1206 domain-containing protein n=1 Tax=Scopulibacillus cellulosilyticus TaxID=2665665 RepID=A0ABW2Q074_9BACL
MGKTPFIKDDHKFHKVKEQTKPWVIRFARFGHMAQGAVYFIIGLLAMQTAFGLHGKLVSSEGALHTIAKQPFGFIGLIVLAAGLCSYGCWQIIAALFDPQNIGHNLKGIVTRIGYLFVAGIYISLCISAVKMLMHVGVKDPGHHYQTLSAKMLAEPFGQTIIGLLGAGILIFGIGQVFWALSGKFQKNLKKNKMSRKEWLWSGRFGKFGISARGVVFGIIGFFLIRTAIQADPNETKGLDGALAEVSRQPYGSVLLAVAAVGLIAYGVYMFAEARYKRLDS